MKTMLHNHTEHSIKDSVMTIKEFVRTAKEMGIEVLTLCDHGVATGWYSFYQECMANDIKPILGVELYVVSPEAEAYDIRNHLCVYAMNNDGFKAIMKAIKLSNQRVVKVGTNLYPECTLTILEQCFGKGSMGYGNVVATTACVNGVVCGLHFLNQKLIENYNVIDRKLSENANVKRMLEILKAKNSSDEKIVEEMKNLKKKALSEDKLASLIAEKENLQKITRSQDELVAHMEETLLAYDNLFGHNNLYAEIQYHGLMEEKQYMFLLDQLAEKHNIPTCAANDAHMATRSEKDILSRETIRGLMFNNITLMEESEKECYMKNGDELFAALCKVITPARATIAMENTEKMFDGCTFAYPENPQHYPVYSKSVDAKVALRNAINEGIQRRFPNGLPEGYAERIEEEFKVMQKLNVCDYIMITQNLLRFAEKLGKMPIERYEYLEEHIWEMTYDEIIAYVEADQSYFGYVKGPGRGSAAGSLICFLVGITDIDPIPLNLLFSRFLNEERVSMPDIDSDYANGVRDLVIVYTYKKFGQDAVCRIITFNTNSAKAAIKNVARALGLTRAINRADKEDPVVIKYRAIGDKLAKVCSGKPHDVLANYDDVWASLTDEVEIEIINRAKAIEGSNSTYGMHACGVIISDNDDVNEYIPLSWDEGSKSFKAQAVPAEAEAMGLLKMDYLGLKNLNIITDTIRLVEKTRGIRLNPSDFPEDKDVIKTICSKGATNSIFQLESAGMKDICKRMKPDCFEDIVLLVAAYRPGPMDSIPSIIDIKTGKKAPTYLTPELEHILNVTYCSPIYQEQVQQIFRDLAGYSFGQADNVRRAMAKKKEKVLLAEREAFVNGDTKRNIKGCVANGISAEIANELFDSMISFASYAFNKSHAAAYARIAYIMMYLKHYYFKEFMTICLKYSNQKRILSLINECQENGVQVLPPDINKSQNGFLLENDIIFGFSAIKGITNADIILNDRNLFGPYTSFYNFVDRCKIKKDAMAALIMAGAFSEFGSRKALLSAYAALTDIMDKKREKMRKAEIQFDIITLISSDVSEEEKLAGLKALGRKGKKIPNIASEQKKMENYSEQFKQLNEESRLVEIPVNLVDDLETNLQAEKELMGVYLTGHPTESYVCPSNAKNIEDVSESKSTTLFGVITNLKITKRKADGKPMAFFDLEDKTGTIKVNCFTKAFELCGADIEEGKVIEIVGSIREDEFSTNDDEDNEVEKEMVCSMYELKPAVKKTASYLLTVATIAHWADICTEVFSYNKPDGCQLIIWDQLNNELRDCNFRVSESIIANSKFAITSYK